LGNNLGYKSSETIMKNLFFLLVLLILTSAAQSQSAGKLYKKGLACYERQDFVESMFFFTRAIAKKPGLAEAYYYRGLARKAEYRNTTIICNGRPLNDSGEDIIIILEPGQTISDKGKNGATCKLSDPRKEIDSLNEIIKVNPADATALFNRGKAKNSLKDYEGAIADLTKAIEIEPEQGHAYLLRSDAKMSLHDAAGAKKDLEKALEVKNDYKIMNFNLDGTRNSPGHSLEIDDYTMAIKIKPDYADAWFHRGLASIKLKQKESGCTDLKKAGELGNAEAAGQLEKHCR
jgi:tetratricopeptide (TPR) repeat protein